MIMDLPKNFVGSIANTKAIITENNQLVLHSACYKDVVRHIVKLIHGVDICQYCGKEILPGQFSIDHTFPQYLGGGVEITNFLNVACRNCNGDKGDLTLNQYLQLIELRKQGASNSEIKQFRADAKAFNEQVFKETHRFQLPDECVDYYFSINDIEVNGRITENEIYNSKGYRALKGFYNEYGYFKHPIILDKKGKLADGRRIYEFAKVRGFKIVPVIIVDNLEIWF